MSNNSPNTNTSSIGNQILADAGYFPPLIYDLLTRFSSLQTNSDSLSDQYIPLTDVNPPASNATLPFIVGFIPPSSTIPPNAQISRESSVAANSVNPNPGIQGSLAASNPGLPSGNNAGGATTISSSGVAFIAEHEGFVGTPYNIGEPGTPGLGTIGYGHVIQPGENITPPITQDQAMTLLQNDTAWAQKAVTQNVTAPLTQNQFDMLTSMAYSTGAGGFKKYGAGVISAVNSGNPSAAAAAIPTTAVTNANGQVIPQVLAIRNAEATNFLLPDGAALQPSGLNSRAPIPSSAPNNNAVGSDVSNPSGWNNGNGSSFSQTAAQQQDSVTNTTLNQTTQGTQFLAQQQAQMTALTALYNVMTQTPPLRLLVNPRSVKNSMEKVISDGNWGRNGPIIEHWGENLDKLEGAGKIAAFYSLDVGQTPIGGSASWPGLTRMARNYSTAYQNLLSLYLIYRSNAGIWTQDYINPQTNSYGQAYVNLAVLGSIYIFYDNILYIGSFDNFTISESDEAPFSLEYSFSFTVRAWFCLDQQQDPELAFQAPVNGTPVPGIQPLPGSIPTQSRAFTS